MDFLAPLLPGLVWTLKLFLVGTVVAAACALPAGLARLSPDPILRGLSRIYVEVFRGTSLLVQLFWFVFAFPLLGVDLDAETVAYLLPGINIGAYGAEVVRGAVQSVPHGQTEAAIALNLTKAQRMRHVVLPQAFVAMLPPFGNLLVELLKSTALCSMILINELTREALFVRDHTGEALKALGAALVFYYVIARIVAVVVRRLERRAARRWHLGGQA